MTVVLALQACTDRPGPIGPQPFLQEVAAAGTGEIFRGSFSPDGREFYFFRKVTAGQEDYRAFRTTLDGDVWSPPERLPLGDPNASSMYPAISPAGELLVFSSYRGSGQWSENANLWVSQRGVDGWGDPVLLDLASTPENYDASPWFGPSGELRFTSTSPDWSETWFRRAPRDGERFGSWKEDPLWGELAAQVPGHHLWSGTLDPSGTVAVVEVSERLDDGTLADADLWIAHRRPEGWDRLRPARARVNTGGVENFPTFSPDGLRLIFVRDFSSFFIVPVSDL